MAKKINVLAELLKCALFGEVVNDYVKTQTSENAKLLYNVSLRHDIAHLVEYAIKKSGISVAGDVADEFVKQQVMAVMRYENLSIALKNISGLFEKEKIPFIALKGAVIRDFYPEPWMRTSCDIDILVREEDLVRAKNAVVEELGFTCNKKHGYHDISLYSKEDVHLELHFSVKENIDDIDRLLEKVWEHSSPKNDGSYEYVMTNEFFMFHTIAHMSYHFRCGGCGIRSYIDLLLLQRIMKYDEAKLLQMLECCSIRRFYEVSLRFLDVWFSDAEHDEVTRSVHDYLLGGSAYGKQSDAIAIKKGRKGMASYVLGRTFIPYEKLCITYPSLKGKRYLTPLYQIRRWIRVLLNKRILDTPDEISQAAKVDNQKIDSLEELFVKVGLK